MKVISKILAAILVIIMIATQLSGYLVIEADTALNSGNITSYFEENTLKDILDNEENREQYDYIRSSMRYWAGFDDEMLEKILDSRTMSHISADVVTEVVKYTRKDAKVRLNRDKLEKILDNRFPEFADEGIKLMNYHQHYLRDFFYDSLVSDDCLLTEVYGVIDQINSRGLCQISFVNVFTEMIIAIAGVCLVIGLLIALVRWSFYKAAIISGIVTLICAIFPLLSFLNAVRKDLFANQKARVVTHVIAGASKASVLVWSIIGFVCGILLIIWGLSLRKKHNKKLAAKKAAVKPAAVAAEKKEETKAEPVEETEAVPEEEPVEEKDVVDEAFSDIHEEVMAAHETLGGDAENTQNVLEELNASIASKAEPVEDEVLNETDEIKEAVGETAEEATETAAEISETVEETAETVEETAEEVTEEITEEKPEETAEEPVEEKAEGRTCPECGKENDAESRFCRFCGHDMEAEKKLTCPNCGHEYEKGMKYCGRCGHKLPEHA